MKKTEVELRGIKRLRITTDFFRNVKEGFSNLIFWIACGLWNFHLGVMKGLVT